MNISLQYFFFNTAKYTFLRGLTDKSCIIDWIDNEELSLQIELSKAERKSEKIKADKQQLEDEILQHNKRVPIYLFLIYTLRMFLE